MVTNIELNQLTAISPLDGRYFDKVKMLADSCSEFGLMRYKVAVEINWLMTLASINSIKEIPKLSTTAKNYLQKIVDNFSLHDAHRIKEIEQTTNHDSKAVEYFLKEKFANHSELTKIKEFLHFACTSDDISNLAYALILKDLRMNIILPQLTNVITHLKKMAHEFADVAMLSRTHGQAATPTTIGKELANYVYRLQHAQQKLADVKILGKFNGTVGNYNTSVIAYPNVDWIKVTHKLVTELGLEFNTHTTQIESHDFIAELSHAMELINTICIDFARNVWLYISLGYFQQKIKEHEVGSSTMPHKVNPIDFENAEGNLGLANCLFNHFATKLPISRWQRDLSDSTVLRNLGTAFGYSMIAYQALFAGINKLSVNRAIIADDLNHHWEILGEAIQTVMRRYGIEQPYEKMKALTRGKTIDQKSLHAFIDQLEIPAAERTRLKKLTPKDYVGLAKELAKI